MCEQLKGKWLFKGMLSLYSILFMLNVNGQQISKLRGAVVSNGMPLANVTVQVLPTKRATVTDVNGKFLFSNLPKEATSLRFTSIGYLPVEVAIVSDSLTLEMVATEQSLGDVVVIGYGSKKKEDLTTAVSTVNLDASMKSRPSNLTSIIQGQLPGVTVQANGGDPMTADALSVRGQGSRQGDPVLFVVDGVLGAPFNIEDVESITVLKDAASASIYGINAGSGGVFIVTTKKAKQGAIKVDANVSKGFKSSWRLPKVLTSEEFNRVRKDAFDAAVTKDGYSRSFPEVSDATKYPYGQATRTDWMKEIFRVANVDHYAISASGGNEKVRGFGSFSYDKIEGILRNTFADRFGAKSSVDFQVADWLKLSQRATYQYNNGQGNLNTTSHEGALISAVFFPRSVTPYETDASGQIVRDAQGNPLYSGTIPRRFAATGITGFGEIRNPYAILMRLRQNRPTHDLLSTTSLELKPVRGITLRSDFSPRAIFSRYEDFSPRIPEIGRPSPENTRTISSGITTSWLWENTATYDKRYNQHQFTAMIGMSLYSWTNRYSSSTVADFDSEDPYNTLMGVGRDFGKYRPFEAIEEERLGSVLGRIDYSYDNRYFVTASARNDRSSRFYKSNSQATFPAISAAWKVSSEDFFEGVLPTISLLKLRLSWGQVGNKNSARLYNYNVAMANTPDPAFFGNNLQTMVFGTFQKSISNYNLTWERSEQSDFGLDIEVMKKLSITVDYFNKITRDLIELVPLPSTMGVKEAPYGNIGKVANRGWEILTKYNTTIGKVDWSIFGNISTVKNEVLNIGTYKFMANDINVNGLQPLRSTVGQPWNAYYLVQTNGIFQTQEEIDKYLFTDKNGNTNKIQPNAKPGDLKFVDFNNDGRINDDDRQYIGGSYLPKLTYAFGSQMSWKGIDLSFFFQGISGVKIFNGFKAMGLTGRQSSNMLADVLNSWEYNKTSGIPRFGVYVDPNGNYNTVSDFMLEDGSYLRLKNVVLGYKIPASVMTNMGLKNLAARFYVNGENLLTFTKYTGFDPEVGNMGVDGGRYPVARAFLIGLNLNF